MTRLLRIFTLLLTLPGLQPAARALTADVSVNAKLSHRVAEVGQPMQLEIQVSGGEVDGREPGFKVDGLEIDFVGPSHSRRMEIVNGRMSSSVDTTYVYQVTAKREGEFKIPGVDLRINGKDYQTQPIALKIQKGSGRTGDATASIAFAEIDVEKKSAYVGEVMPVEVRLYLKAGVRAELSASIEISGDGFTVQKAPEPVQQSEMRDGTEYNVFSYRTVMTPSKAGKLSVGPCEIPFVAQVPRPGQRRMRSFGGTVFEDFFDSMGGFSERRRFDAKAPEVAIDVKPLPAEGRPKSFAGAVGHYGFQAEGAPTKLKVGDPITMRLKVTGTGNFDRVTAPSMEDEKGWQSYDASESFEAVDPLKTTGTKTFELPIVPDGPHRETPVFSFAYFDPKTEKYVALRSKPQPLTIEGAAVARLSAKPEIESVAPEPPKAEAKAASDLLGLRYEVGAVRLFSPLYARREFWLFQAVPVAGLLALLAVRLLRRDPLRVQQAALERKRQEAWSQVRSDQNPADFWEHAARVVQLDTAIASGVEPGGVDAEVVKRVRGLDPETVVAVDEIFEHRNALLFAGRGVSDNRLNPAQRERVLAVLDKLGRR